MNNDSGSYWFGRPWIAGRLSSLPYCHSPDRGTIFWVNWYVLVYLLSSLRLNQEETFNMSCKLQVDRFYISYALEEPMIPVPTAKSAQLGRKTALFKSSVRISIALLFGGWRGKKLTVSSNFFFWTPHQEIERLSQRMDSIHIDSDILRYIRDIVVGIRMHPKVRGGLTARASMDCITAVK